MIHQLPHLDAHHPGDDDDGAVSFQIRHADRQEEAGASVGLDTEQGTVPSRSPLAPWSTQSHPRNEMSVGQRLLWIAVIAMGASFSAGMYLAGLESLARLAGR
ncbi:MAG TPA: hypothetical protein VM913_04455 [Sphingomicrobium sp.]|nr:hypothetical protein [Sphingomicrobium sp.]